MKLRNISQDQDTINFKAIKSIRCTGLYKKFPNQAKTIVTTLKENPLAMDFCKQNDVHIEINLTLNDYCRAESFLHISYTNINKSLLEKFIKPVADGYITCFGWGSSKKTVKSIIEATESLRSKIAQSCKENYSLNHAITNIDS